MLCVVHPRTHPGIPVHHSPQATGNRDLSPPLIRAMWGPEGKHSLKEGIGVAYVSESESGAVKKVLRCMGPKLFMYSPT